MNEETSLKTAHPHCPIHHIPLLINGPGFWGCYQCKTMHEDNMNTIEKQRVELRGLKTYTNELKDLLYAIHIMIEDKIENKVAFRE